MTVALLIPSAHLSHWAWVFYLIPLLIIVAGILRSTRREKKREREGSERHRKKTKSEY